MSIEKLLAENTTAQLANTEALNKLLAQLDQAAIVGDKSPAKRSPKAATPPPADDDDLLGGDDDDVATMEDVLGLATRVLKEDTENVTANREAMRKVLKKAGVEKVKLATAEHLPILYQGFKAILDARS